MARTANIQNAYLNEMRKDKLQVTVFLTNGFQLRGKIEAFDNFTVLLRSDGQQQLIYKHAISTFVPEQNISIPET